MHFLGVYHKTPFLELKSATDAPYMEKGRDALAAEGIATEPGRMACVSGRIRNLDALAAALELRRPSPGEVLLAAYRRWGEGYAEHIEGPAATVILDRDRDRLLLARDRMGDRPVFYSQGDNFVAFADHPDALLEMGACRPVVDADGLNELFALGPARTPGRTPYRLMRALEPGCLLVAADGKLEIRRYFALTARTHEDDPDRTVRRVREILERAVADISPLHPAVMLSGGLDSSTLTGLMANLHPQIESFSLDYEGNEKNFLENSFQPTQDEPYVNMASEVFGTRHTRVLIAQKHLAEALFEATDARGFPGMADVDSSLLLFARAISQRARSVVSGECADEVFGGYPWFREAASLRPDAFPWSGSVELRAKILKKQVREKLRPALYVRETVAEAIARVNHLPGEGAQDACLRTMQNLCFQFFMANLQERAVQICAHCNLNVLTPFSDERLTEYVYNVPWDMKFLNGEVKGLLRAAAEGVLPGPLLHRKKSPYPKTYSPDYARIISKMTSKMLADKRSPILACIDKEEVERLARSKLSPAQTPWFGQLMTGVQMLAYLLQVNEWMASRKVEIQL